MSYQIRYGDAQPPSERCRAKSKKSYLQLALFLLLAAVLFQAVFPAQASSVRQALFPALTDETAAAFQEMVANVRSGTGFEEAVTAFCREIIEDAQIPID